MDALVTLANVLYVSAYFTKNMLVLRALSLVAACCLASYFLARPEPLLQVAAWNIFFALLNAVWVWRIAAGRFGRSRASA